MQIYIKDIKNFSVMDIYITFSWLLLCVHSASTKF